MSGASAPGVSSVAVLGSANLDISVRVERHPGPGETVFGRGLDTGLGGKGLNQAVAAARAGASVSFIGAVGDDAFGERVRSGLLDEGIDVTQLRIVPGTTGTAHVTVADDGENAIVVVPAANSSLGALDPAVAETIRASSALVTQCEVPLVTIASAIETAARADVPVILTPAPVVELPPALLERVDVLVPNATEAMQLAGVDDPEAAALALSERGGTVIVTLGDSGCLVARAGQIEARLPAFATDVLDTTGAGDCFVGAFVAQHVAGVPLLDAVRWAVAAASIAVSRCGAAAAAPTRAEIDRRAVEPR